MQVDVIDDLTTDPSIPRPEEIRVTEGTFCAGRFGKHEVEVSAGKLVTFFKARGKGWSPFTITELVTFYQTRGWDPNLMFFGLCGLWFDDAPFTGGYIESNPYLAVSYNGKYRVTDLFIEACKRP